MKTATIQLTRTELYDISQALWDYKESILKMSKQSWCIEPDMMKAYSERMNDLRNRIKAVEDDLRRSV